MTDLKEAIYESTKETERKLERLENDQRILPENKAIIKDFLKRKVAEGISKQRQCLILQHLTRMGRIANKPLDKFTDTDLRDFLANVESKGYSAWTKNTTRILIKNILRLHGWKHEQLEWIKNRRPPTTITAEDLLSDSEVNSMVAAAPSLMWKAAIGILHETGIRPGELLSLRIKDVIRNGCKYRLMVTGKMEYKQGRRPAYVYQNMPLLQNWLAQHPQRSTPEASIFITEEGKPLRMIILNKVFKKIAVRAKVRLETKECKGKDGKTFLRKTSQAFPYILRHGRLTRYYRDFGAVVGAELAGHTQGSREIATYLHLSGDDVEKKLDAANGVGEDVKPVELQKCPSCSLNNPLGEIFCVKCQTALNSAGALVHEEDNAELLKLLSDEKIRNVLKSLAANTELVKQLAEEKT